MSDTETIFQLKLTLTDSVPEVWRRVQVPGDFTLGDFHYVILYAFCWFDDRPHEFVPSSKASGRQAVGTPCDEDSVSLSDVLRGPNAQMRYRCESGDRWEEEEQASGLDVASDANNAFTASQDGTITRSARPIDTSQFHSKLSEERCDSDTI